MVYRLDLPINMHDWDFHVQKVEGRISQPTVLNLDYWPILVGVLCMVRQSTTVFIDSYSFTVLRLTETNRGNMYIIEMTKYRW